MTGDEMRDQLAAVLKATSAVLYGTQGWPIELAQHYADALLPTVRKIAADELRAAAEDFKMPRNGRNICLRRADTLDPS